MESAKEKNKTVMESVRSILSDSCLPKSFWSEDVSTVLYVQNKIS